MTRPKSNEMNHFTRTALHHCIRPEEEVPAVNDDI